MALPSTIDSTTPAGSASPALGDDQIRALKLSIVDIFGVPDNTAVSVAAFAMVAGGLDEIILRNAAADASATGRVRRNATNLTWHDGTAARNIYFAAGTDVALADGGTGASLTDPNADRLMFWDDSAGAVAFLTAGTGLTIAGTTMTASGGPIAVQVFASSGTYTPTSGAAVAIVEVWGGGGGGGAESPDNTVGGGGGGGGGYALYRYATPASQTVTVGAGGTAPGGTGGTTSFGSLVSATGGSGGSNGANTVGGAGGGGGAGSSGSLNFTGQGGAAGGDVTTGGAGGMSPRGAGGGRGVSSGAGAAGSAPGGAGGGGLSGGGAGGAGMVVVTEY